MEVKITNTIVHFLVNRLQGSRTMVQLSEEVVKPITIRIEEPTLTAINEMVEKTDGWSRNLVVNFLLMGGLELVNQQLRQYENELEALIDGEAIQASNFKMAEEAKEKK